MATNPNTLETAGNVDKSYLYGRYQGQEDIDNNRVNNNREWKDGLHKKLIHKSLDIPMSPEDEDMNVDARKEITSTSSNGLDWKHLAIITAGIIGGGMLLKQPTQQPVVYQQPQGPIVPPAVSQPIDQKYRTMIEIRDKNTGQPIKVDWLDGNSPPPKQSQPSNTVSP